MVEILIKAHEVEYKPNSTIFEYVSGTPIFDNLARYLDQNVEMKNYESSTRFDDIEARLEKLEQKLEQESKIREENHFVKDLYIQYQAALKLAMDSDQMGDE